MVATFEKVNASKIRVTQTENAAAGYWSIHEAYIADIANSAIEETIADNYSVTFENGTIVFNGDVFEEDTSIAIYNLIGKTVKYVKNPGRSYSLTDLSPDIYIVEVRNSAIGRKLIKIRK